LCKKKILKNPSPKSLGEGEGEREHRRRYPLPQRGDISVAPGGSPG
jgi:hypothetical protein